MTSIQTIVALFTFGGWALTAVKIYCGHTKWYWNLAPFICGFTSCLWIALIFG